MPLPVVHGALPDDLAPSVEETWHPFAVPLLPIASVDMAVSFSSTDHPPPMTHHHDHVNPTTSIAIEAALRAQSPQHDTISHTTHHASAFSPPRSASS